MPRYQLGSIRKENRADGLTWILRYYATRMENESNGRFPSVSSKTSVPVRRMHQEK